MKDDSLEFVCMKCARPRSVDVFGGFCPDHPDEPLLDVRLDCVKFEMMASDDRLRNRVYGFWIILTTLPMLAVAGVVLSFRFVPRFILKYLFLGLVVGGSSLGFVIAKARYKPRFRRWTSDIDPEGDD